MEEDVEDLGFLGLQSYTFGHGGGDARMVHEFVQYLRGEIAMSPTLTSLNRSVESHLVALAAEESRKAGGQVVCLR